MGEAQTPQAADIELLEGLAPRHIEAPGSARTWPRRAGVERWDHELPLFWKVAPHVALTEAGPPTVVHKRLASLKESSRAALRR